jgi:hypothetical protein
MGKKSCELGAWIEGMIRDFVNESPENSLRNETDEKAWGDPLVGFSSGADPLYSYYKGDIGSFFLTPEEWFEAAFPEMGVPGEELTVISARACKGKRISHKLEMEQETVPLNSARNILIDENKL